MNQGRPTPARKVLLIGWDAADWQVIHPLLDSGQMPTLARFVDAGVIGNLASLQPMLSPMLWNSIATGQRAHRHGIGGFVEPRADGAGVQPVSSTSRQTKALWNILAQNGLRCQVTGWFASHPAEPLPGGVCVSNRFQLAPHEPLPAGCVFPARLAETLSALRVQPGELEGGHLQPFVPRAAEVDQTDPVARKPLEVLAQLLAETASVHAAATWALEHEPWDFAAVYYDGIDHFGHAFMPFHPPRMPGIDAGLFDLYRDVVTGVYRFHDMMLERLLQLAGDDATVLLVSDHGFHSGHLRPGATTATDPRAANPVAWHRPHGVLAMRGPGLRVDDRVHGATLLDLAPTILTLFGLPAGEDMEGRVLVEAFREPSPTVARIPTWETVPGADGMHPPGTRQNPLDAYELLRQFVALGYLDPPPADHEAAAEAAARELRFNFARSTLHAGLPEEAAALLAPLTAAAPTDAGYALTLAQAQLALGRPAEARRLVEPVLAALPAGGLPQADLLLGILLLAEGRPVEALTALHRAERAEPGLPRLHNQLGAVYLRSRQWRAAARAFRRALRIDPDSAGACCGLATAMRRMGRPRPAANWALRALGLQHFFPAAHGQLGFALAALGQGELAVRSLETALTMAPGAASVRRYLERLRRRLGDLGAAHAA